MPDPTLIDLPSPENSTTGRFMKRYDRWPFRVTRAGFRWLGIVSPRLAAAAAEQLFRTPRRHARPPREQEWLRAATRVRVRLGVDHVAAWVWGPSHAPATLLVHGWEGRGAQLGALAEPLVAGGRRVIAFDAPAHGESPGRVSSLPEFVDAIWAVSRQLGRPDTIAAHSLGAAAAIAALREGLPVRRLALIAPPADLSEAITRFSSIMGISSGVRHRFEAQLERRFGDLAPLFRITDAVAGLDARALIVHDRDDHEIPLAEGTAVADRFRPDAAHLEVTEGLGHRRILRDPEVIARIVAFMHEASLANNNVADR